MGKNLLNIMQGAEIDQNAKERVLIYARAGTGKSRFGLSVPASWGKIGYYAADKNSWLLRSISKAKRDRVVVVNPEGDDPTALFMQFAMLDWSEIDPEVGVIVVDTYTKVAMDSVSFSANTLAVDREKHYIIGELGKGGVAIPNRGDYQGVDALSKDYLDALFSHQQDKHIIFIMHEESKQVGGKDGPIIGGPQHPGWTMIDYLPSQFSTVVRLIREEEVSSNGMEMTPVVVAITEYDGKFPAKLRTDDEEAPNPLARVRLQRNPAHWWESFEAYCQGRLESSKPKKKSRTTQEVA